MTTATQIQTMLTADDLLAMPDDGKKYELVRGELIEMPPPSVAHAIVTGRIGYRIAHCVEANNLPFIYGPEAGIFIEQGPDTVRAADYVLFARERIPDTPPERGYIPGLIPDLAVEVLSPGNSRPAAERRAQMWLDAGVRLVLTAYIDANEIVTCHDDGTVRVFAMGDTLTLDPVLPGFACPVADIFTY